MKKFFTTLLMLTAMVSMNAQTDPDHMYVIGNVPFGDWKPNAGVEMTKTDAYCFEIENIHIDASTYLSFTSELAETDSDWDYIAPYRLAAPANNYEINAGNFGKPIALNEWGVNVDNAFLITGGGDYKIEVYTDELLVVFTPNGDIQEEIVEPDGNIYIMGQVNGNEWAPNVGVKMTDEGNNIYTAIVTTTADSCTFDFTKALSKTASNWAGVAPYRFGAVENGTWVALNEAMPLGEEGNDNAFKMCDAGTYLLTLDLEARTLTVTESELEDAMYIIGNDPFNNWDPSNGVKMVKNGDIYTYEASIPGDVWFIFADALGSWDIVNGGHRYGPLEANEDVVAGEDHPTQISGNGNASYKVGAGEYVITFDKANLTFRFDAKGATTTGDVNGDNKVDVEDVNAVINMILKVSETTAAGDVNNDGKVDVEDVNAIINIILKV